MRNRAILVAFLALAIGSLALSACGVSVSTANIQDAVLAKGYDNGNAVDPANIFAPEDQEIHLIVNVGNAPDDTNVKTVWSSVAVAGYDPAVLYEQPLTLNSGETVAHFTLTNDNPWPAGQYKVDLYLNDKLDRTLTYQVEGPQVTAPTVDSATLARGYANGQPVDPTTIFAPDDLQMYLIVKVANAVDGTGLKAVWSVAQVEGYDPAVIDETSYTFSAGADTANFSLSNTEPWPAGKYKVDLYLDDALVQTLDYEVREPEVTTPTVEGATLARGYAAGEAVDPTNLFAPEDLEIHLVVKVANPVEGAALKAVWSVVEVAGYDPAVIDETSYALAAGEDSADFSLTNDQPWPVGRYQVELYLGDTLVQTLDYRVLEAGVPAPSVEAATLAKKSASDGSMVAAGLLAPTDLEIHLLVDVANPVEGATLKAVWSAVEVEGYDPQVIYETPYTLGAGESSVDFSLINDQPWSVGKYKVELYLGDTLAQTLEYEIR